LFNRIRKDLFPAVVGDVMDKLGLLHQFLPPTIQPLRADMVILGRAMPVLVEDLHDDNRHLHKEKPFGLMLEALDDLRTNEVYIASGASPQFALWGELMSTRAIQLGSSGAVLNGYSRDTPGILSLNFPTFSYGCYAQDQGPRGRVVDFRQKISIGKVEIAPGDIVFGDVDGVCIIPQSAEDEVIKLAIEKATGEKVVQREILNGMSAVEAFRTYGIM
ncbi:MAG: RraA family protein, partial [Saprospiraceae bacterium]|nr:RraA family protein [Saprospiraceae bacterium]